MIVRWGLSELGPLLEELGFTRPLLVTSPRHADLELCTAVDSDLEWLETAVLQFEHVVAERQVGKKCLAVAAASGSPHAPLVVPEDQGHGVDRRAKVIDQPHFEPTDGRRRHRFPRRRGFLIRQAPTTRRDGEDNDHEHASR